MTMPSQINPPRNKQRQRGAALIVMGLILVLGLITLFTFSMERRGPELDADRKTAMALAQAKEALLGRAVSNDDPGTLPCPDFNGDGLLTIGSGDYLGQDCGSYLGWLPSTYFDMGELRDGANGKLWYLLSENFKDNNNYPIPSTMGTLSISGISPQSNLVAIIVAPGAPVSGQSQPASDATGYAQYLESYISEITLNSAVPSSAYNDRFITITTADIFNITTQRMAAEFALLLPSPPTYYPISPPADWAINWPEWSDITQYGATGADNNATLQFPPCNSVFTISWNGSRNMVINRSPKTC